MTSVLELVKRAAVICRAEKPTQVFGSQSQESEEWALHLGRALSDLRSAFDWAALRVDRTWETVEGEAQPGALGADFDRFTGLHGVESQNRLHVYRHGLDRTNVLHGWAGAASYHIADGVLVLRPAPPAGTKLNLVYQSKNAVLGGAGAQAFIMADSDEIVLDEDALVLFVARHWARHARLEATASTVTEDLQRALAEAQGRERPNLPIPLSPGRREDHPLLPKEIIGG